MKVETLAIEGLKLITPDRFGDARGWFMEAWQQPRYEAAGIDRPFRQDDLVKSAKGVLRGLHAQAPFAQGKLVQVVAGQAFDVAVDLRPGSPSFGRWHGLVLDGDVPCQFYIPPGFVHGYYVLSECVLMSYKCTDVYAPEHQFAVRWDDPEIGIDWPLDGEPTLSAKDRAAPLLKDVPPARLERYREPA